MRRSRSPARGRSGRRGPRRVPAEPELVVPRDPDSEEEVPSSSTSTSSASNIYPLSCHRCHSSINSAEEGRQVTDAEGYTLREVCAICSLLEDCRTNWEFIPKDSARDSLVRAALTEVYLALRDRADQHLSSLNIGRSSTAEQASSSTAASID